MLFFIKPWKILLWALLTQKLQNKIFISKNLAQSLLKLDGTLMSCKKIENFYEQFWRKIPDKQTNGLFNSNYFTSAKKCWCERCIINFTSAKMEFTSAIFKKLYFSKYSKGVVNRLPPFKNLSDHTNMFLMG